MYVVGTAILSILISMGLSYSGRIVNSNFNGPFLFHLLVIYLIIGGNRNTTVKELYKHCTYNWLSFFSLRLLFTINSIKWSNYSSSLATHFFHSSVHSPHHGCHCYFDFWCTSLCSSFLHHGILTNNRWNFIPYVLFPWRWIIFNVGQMAKLSWPFFFPLLFCSVTCL